MKTKKWYWGVFAAVLLMCAMIFPAMAAENGSTSASIVSQQEVSQNVGNTLEDEDSEADPEETDSEPESETTGPETTVVEVTGVTLDCSKYTAHVVGQTIQLTAVVTPEDATDPTVTWISSNESVAAVDENGLVTIMGGGNAVITASAGDCTATCTISASLYNGIYEAPDGSGWFYYKNGEVDTSRTDVIHCTVKGDYAWWYFKNGQVSFTETVAKNSNGWWYIKDGKVDFTYTGFAENANGWWYLENGKVTFKTNSVIKGTVDGKTAWWYVVKSQVQTDFTGLADYSNENGWWYIEDGRVTFNANTVAKNKNGWFYVKNSKVIFTYTGFAENKNGWWYIEKGKVTFQKNSVIKGTVNGKTAWWYVVGSKVQTDFTGLADYSNANGWWYIEDGYVTFTKNTVAKNKNGWYYVVDSKVQFGFTGLADYSNENGWWYIKKGKVDFSANTVAKNKNGWWYVKGGKVRFDYTGIGTNSNGTWYIENGKVNFSYTGWKTINDSRYYIYKGQVAINGRIVSGGNLYYFNSSGVLSRTVYGNKKMVALTYDDGPSKYTSTILDTLEKYNSVATFFVVGNRVNSYSSTVKRAYNMGCQIGNHTYDHKILTSIATSTISSQISKTNSVIKSVTGANPTVMRPPGGSVNSTVKSTVGMPIILWSVDTLDWKTRNATSTINSVLNNVKDGDIILMHDLYSATATASQTIIPTLVNRGYQLVTVEEMAALRGGMKNGVTYSSFR